MLSAMDRKDFDWYANLPDEHKKEWSSWLALRWASSVKGKGADDALLNTNEFVNKNYTDIYKHDDLVWKLFCLTGSGKKQFHTWVKAPNTKMKKDKIDEFLMGMYPHMKADELALYRKMNDDSDIRLMAIGIGMPDKEVNEIFGKPKRKKKSK